MPISWLRAGAARVWDDTTQWLSNIWEVFSEGQVKDFIPPWIWESFWDSIDFFGKQVPAVVGYKATPYEQMVASVVIGGGLVVVSIGALTYVAVLLVFPFLVGVIRLHPFVERHWPLTDSDGRGVT